MKEELKQKIEKLKRLIFIALFLMSMNMVVMLFLDLFGQFDTIGIGLVNIGIRKIIEIPTIISCLLSAYFSLARCMGFFKINKTNEPA